MANKFICLDDIAEIELLTHCWTYPSLCKRLADLFQVFADNISIRQHHSSEINAHKHLIVRELRKIKFSGILQTRHCKLDIAASRREYIHSLLYSFTGECVYHYINALILCHSQYFLLEIMSRIVDKVFYAHACQIFQLGIGTCGSIHIKPLCKCVLNGYKSCTACRTLYKYLLVFPDPYAFKDMMHCHENNRESAGFFKADISRLAGQRIGCYGNDTTLCAHSAVSKTYYLITYVISGYSRSKLDNNARELKSGNKRIIRHSRIKSLNAKKITEVQ